MRLFFVLRVAFFQYIVGEPFTYAFAQVKQQKLGIPRAVRGHDFINSDTVGDLWV